MKDGESFEDKVADYSDFMLRSFLNDMMFAPIDASDPIECKAIQQAFENLANIDWYAYFNEEEGK